MRRRATVICLASRLLGGAAAGAQPPFVFSVGTDSRTPGPARHGLSLAAGGGMRHEAAGVNLTARVARGGRSGGRACRQMSSSRGRWRPRAIASIW